MNPNYFNGQNPNEDFANFNDDVYANSQFYFENDVYANAPAAQQMNPIAPKSVPFIVTLTNTTGAAVSNVAFLGAVDGVKTGATNYGVTAGVTVSYGYSNITYIDFLYSLLTKSVLIGMTYISATTQAQLLQPITITTKDVRGNKNEAAIIYTVNPFQQQTTVIANFTQFILNQYTTLTIASLAASCSVTIYLYPLKEESSIGALTGQGANNYSAPQITGVQQIPIPAPRQLQTRNLM